MEQKLYHELVKAQIWLTGNTCWLCGGPDAVFGGNSYFFQFMTRGSLMRVQEPSQTSLQKMKDVKPDEEFDLQEFQLKYWTMLEYCLATDLFQIYVCWSCARKVFLVVPGKATITDGLQTANNAVAQEHYRVSTEPLCEAPWNWEAAEQPVAWISGETFVPGGEYHAGVPFAKILAAKLPFTPAIRWSVKPDILECFVSRMEAFQTKALKERPSPGQDGNLEAAMECLNRLFSGQDQAVLKRLARLRVVERVRPFETFMTRFDRTTEEESLVERWTKCYLSRFAS